MQKAGSRASTAWPFRLRMKKPPLGRAERDLIRAEKLIELYEPFILIMSMSSSAKRALALRHATARGASALDFAPDP